MKKGGTVSSPSSSQRLIEGEGAFNGSGEPGNSHRATRAGRDFFPPGRVFEKGRLRPKFFGQLQQKILDIKKVDCAWISRWDFVGGKVEKSQTSTATKTPPKTPSERRSPNSPLPTPKSTLSPLSRHAGPQDADIPVRAGMMTIAICPALGTAPDADVTDRWISNPPPTSAEPSPGFGNVRRLTPSPEFAENQGEEGAREQPTTGEEDDHGFNGHVSGDECELE